MEKEAKEGNTSSWDGIISEKISEKTFRVRKEIMLEKYQMKRRNGKIKTGCKDERRKNKERSQKEKKQVNEKRNEGKSRMK